jgi:hypothetical protein
VLSNQNLTHIESDFLIICAIINKFRPQIATTTDSDQIDIYNKMVRKSLESNPFRERCTNEFKKRILKRNMQLDPWVLKFPELSEEYIQRLTLPAKASEKLYRRAYRSKRKLYFRNVQRRNECKQSRICIL